MWIVEFRVKKSARGHAERRKQIHLSGT